MHQSISVRLFPKFIKGGKTISFTRFEHFIVKMLQQLQHYMQFLKLRTPHKFSNVGILFVWDFPIQTYSKHNTNNNDCE